MVVTWLNWGREIRVPHWNIVLKTVGKPDLQPGPKPLIPTHSQACWEEHTGPPHSSSASCLLIWSHRDRKGRSVTSSVPGPGCSVPSGAVA